MILCFVSLPVRIVTSNESVTYMVCADTALVIKQKNATSRSLVFIRISFPSVNKGLAKNNLVEFAPEFALALIDLIEQNRRNSELFRGLLRLKIG
ncbi:MAG: hypothetical protein BA868_04460 [Desulfobacterales bacterium C00003106]|nr:MAG: hypothetical protein BA868_04460 [Desulfobacterales bacterium C00003106]